MDGVKTIRRERRHPLLTRRGAHRLPTQTGLDIPSAQWHRRGGPAVRYGEPREPGKRLRLRPGTLGGAPVAGSAWHFRSGWAARRCTPRPRAPPRPRGAPCPTRARPRPAPPACPPPGPARPAAPLAGSRRVPERHGAGGPTGSRQLARGALAHRPLRSPAGSLGRAEPAVQAVARGARSGRAGGGGGAGGGRLAGVRQSGSRSSLAGSPEPGARAPSGPRPRAATWLGSARCCPACCPCTVRSAPPRAAGPQVRAGRARGGARGPGCSRLRLAPGSARSPAALERVGGGARPGLELVSSPVSPALTRECSSFLAQEVERDPGRGLGHMESLLRGLYIGLCICISFSLLFILSLSLLHTHPPTHPVGLSLSCLPFTFSVFSLSDLGAHVCLILTESGWQVVAPHPREHLALTLGLGNTNTALSSSILRLCADTLPLTHPAPSPAVALSVGRGLRAFPGRVAACLSVSSVQVLK